MLVAPQDISHCILLIKCVFFMLMFSVFSAAVLLKPFFCKGAKRSVSTGQIKVIAHAVLLLHLNCVCLCVCVVKGVS